LEGDNGVRVLLRGDNLVGRSRKCDVCFRHDEWVSGEHAKIHYRGGGWWIKDLGSRNGTQINGAPLSPGLEAPLEQGSVLVFGGRGANWTFAEAGPPDSFAKRLRDDEVVLAEDEILALPSMSEPEVVLYRTGIGDWQMDRIKAGDEVKIVRDGDILRVGDDEWLLQLEEDPGFTMRTIEALDPSAAKIRFVVSRDREMVTCTLVEPRELYLGSNVHHQLMLALAFAWQRDEALPDFHRGWRDFRYLSRELGGWTSNAMNVALYRARRQFAAIGVIDPNTVIQRREGAGLMRIGVRFEILERKE
jgi:hypothetical protein